MRILSLVLAAAIVGGCDLGAGATSTPEGAVRAYVDAINDNDGAAVCSLLVPSVAWEFSHPRFSGCAEFMSLFLAYGEDSSASPIERLKILDVSEGVPRGELRSLELRIEVASHPSVPKQLRGNHFRDVVWLVEREGGWRIAKPSVVLVGDSSAEAVTRNVLDPPDLAAQEREYARERAAARAEAVKEAASYTNPGRTLPGCEGVAVGYDDAHFDQHITAEVGELAPGEAARYAPADIRRIEVSVEESDVCVRVTLAGPPAGRSFHFGFYIFSPLMNPLFLGEQASLSFQMQPSGKARVAYQDESRVTDTDYLEYGDHPLVAVPAEIGVNGAEFGFRVAREVFPPPRSGDPKDAIPPLTGFLFGGSTALRVERAGERRSISDDVHDYHAMVSYPGGHVYESGARSTRDLPTR